MPQHRGRKRIAGRNVHIAGQRKVGHAFGWGRWDPWRKGGFKRDPCATHSVVCSTRSTDRFLLTCCFVRVFLVVKVVSDAKSEAGI